MIKQLPDDIELEDIEYHIHVRRRILRGLADFRSGRFLTEEQFIKKFFKSIALNK